jgi:ADP-heptose:LPS heptosyltransferase
MDTTAPTMTFQRLERGGPTLTGVSSASSRSPAAWGHQLPLSGIFRILICRSTHSLGNTLLLTPLLAELEATYPGAEIDIVTRADAAEAIFHAFPAVRRIVRLPASVVRHPLVFWHAVRQLRAGHYDLVIDPCPRSRTGALLLRLANGRLKLGFAGKPLARLTHAIARGDAPKHTAQRPVFLLRSALGRLPPATYPALNIRLRADECALGAVLVDRLLGDSSGSRGSKGVIGIFANATGHKKLSEAWWQAFAAAFAQRHPDHSVVEIVPMFGRSLLGSRYPAYYSSDIRRLACVLSALRLFVSADCGIMHLACASGVPVIGIFSVTDPDEWGPYGPDDRIANTADGSPDQLAEQLSGSRIERQRLPSALCLPAVAGQAAAD